MRGQVREEESTQRRQDEGPLKSENLGSEEKRVGFECLSKKTLRLGHSYGLDCVSPKTYVEVLIPSTSEYECIWK